SLSLLSVSSEWRPDGSISKSARSTKPGQDSLSPAVTRRPTAQRVSVGWFPVWDRRPACHLSLGQCLWGGILFRRPIFNRPAAGESCAQRPQCVGQGIACLWATQLTGAATYVAVRLSAPARQRPSPPAGVEHKSC